MTNFILLGPILSTVTSLYFSKYLGKNILYVIITFYLISSILSLYLVYIISVNQIIIIYDLSNWSTLLSINIEFYFDIINAVLLSVVMVVGTCVISYTYYYMASDPHLYRFIGLLSGFVTFMSILTISSNLVVLFIGWELIGLFSYLLISFWSDRTEATTAGLSAMLQNKFGDYLLTLGMIFTFSQIYNLDILTLNSIYTYFNNSNWNYIIPLISISYLIAAMAKSAQIGIHIWLIHAMQGKTKWIVSLLLLLVVLLSNLFNVEKDYDLICSMTILLAPLKNNQDKNDLNNQDNNDLNNNQDNHNKEDNNNQDHDENNHDQNNNESNNQNQDENQLLDNNNQEDNNQEDKNQEDNKKTKYNKKSDKKLIVKNRVRKARRIIKQRESYVRKERGQHIPMSNYPLLSKLDSDKQAIIVGTMLGDGHVQQHISKSGRISCKYIMTVSIISYKYIKFIQNYLFKGYCSGLLSYFPNSKLPQHVGKPITQLWFSCYVDPLFNELHEIWYVWDKESNKNLKQVPLDIKEHFNRLSLLHWIIQDGYYVKNHTKKGGYGRVALCTDAFTYAECILLVDALANLGLNSSIWTMTNLHDKNYYRIAIAEKSMPLLIELVEKDMPRQFIYKLGLLEEKNKKIDYKKLNNISFKKERNLKD